MKKHIIIVLVALLGFNASAKKVKFAVDMSGQTISPNGVHIVGDFQVAAGLGPDWDPGKASMIKEGNTSIYSIIVNIPAFRKYEYRFINGDQTYEAEFVPDASRVGYQLVDNRWLYVDSLANDTSFAGAILFGGNAPTGKFLVRYKVSTNHLGVVPAVGFHVAASYQAFNPATIRLYSFGDGIYEIIDYVSAGTYQYKFYNGNTASSAEQVPSSCAVSGNRNLVVSKDTVLVNVCFAECLACTDVGISESGTEKDNFLMYPNPANDVLHIRSLSSRGLFITITDYTGRQIVKTQNGDTNDIDLSGLRSGFYLVHLNNSEGVVLSRKLLVN